MPKRIVGLIIACLLALFGGSAMAEPAMAAPHTATTKAKAAKTAAVKAKSAKAAAAKSAADRAKAAAAARAKAVAAAKARAAAAARAKARAKAKAAADLRRKLIQAGPRASAAARAAATARARVASTARAAAQTRVASAAAARAAAAAQAQSVAIAKTTAKPKVKKKAAAAAKAAVKAAAKAAAKARSRAAAAAQAKVTFAAKERAAVEARLNYVSLAGPRATAAARAAAVARARSVAAAKAATRSRAAASAAGTVAAAARARSAAVAKSTATAKVKKQAAIAAATATKAAAKAQATAVASAAISTRAAAIAKARVRTAAAAKKAAGPNPSWTPKDGLIFNNPKGSKAEKLAIITQLNRAIDATPAGGEIRMAMYLFDIGSVAKKLIAASKRGVSVQILIDDGEANKYIRRVREVEGTNKLSRSFVATCNRGCMASGASVIHAKFYLFSVAGKARYVSMVSSANPYTGNTYNSWNNNQTIVGNPTIYNSLSKYFTDMLVDRKNLNYFRVTTSGKYTVYLYPQKVTRPEDVVLLNVLNQTSCVTTAPGYGSEGRTLIRVANWGWTGARIDIAKRLWTLYDSGCKVQVMINKGRITRNVLKVLLKPSKKYGKMPVYDAWFDANRNDIAGLYVHHKTLTVNGLLSGRNVKIVWTGSQNFTALGTLANNDIILRVVDAAMTDAYNSNFAYIRKHYTNRMYWVPRVTRIKQY